MAREFSGLHWRTSVAKLALIMPASAVPAFVMKASKGGAVGLLGRGHPALNQRDRATSVSDAR